MSILSKAQARKKARTEAAIKRKQTRVEGRNAAKQARIQKRSDASQSRIAKRAKSSMMGNENTELSRLAKVDEAMENTGVNGNEDTNLTLQQQTKAANYLKRRKRQPEKEPDLLAAQVAEERAREIEQRNAAQIAEIKAANQTRATNQNWGLEEGEDMEEVEQDENLEFPDFDDTHEDILEEEEQTFSFDGDEDNYLDPDTLGVVLKASEAATDKYREKRFKEGKKWMGKTKKQWEAEQARKKAVAEGDTEKETAIEAAKRAAEDETIKATKRSYTNEMWAAGIILVLVGVYLYYAGKKSQ